MKLELVTTDVIGRGATEMSKMIPSTPVGAGSSLTHGLTIYVKNT